MNRGPGEFFGEKQSGSMNFKFADLRSDNDILLIANEDSEEIINSKEFFDSVEFETLYKTAVTNYNKKQEEID
jgi:ATP-dependent DNA helicase RecG